MYAWLSCIHEITIVAFAIGNKLNSKTKNRTVFALIHPYQKVQAGKYNLRRVFRVFYTNSIYVLCIIIIWMNIEKITKTKRAVFCCCTLYLSLSSFSVFVSHTNICGFFYVLCQSNLTLKMYIKYNVLEVKFWLQPRHCQLKYGQCCKNNSTLFNETNKDRKTSENDTTKTKCNYSGEKLLEKTAWSSISLRFC